ncbi:MAG: SCO1664 family protein [Candidatus Methylomirabilia bacterium]
MRPVDPCELLTRGEIRVRGQLAWSTNATFLVELGLGEASALAVYKPVRGEQPLWDFPPGLFKRELAAYHLSEALGWGLVPLTVQRRGPYGDGSLQLFVPADFEQHYFTLREDPGHRDRLMWICVFDLLANNADRKSGHCLLGADGLVYAVDNALTFHVEPKLRTVIWDFAGDPIPVALLADIRRLLGRGLPPALVELLDRDEREALLGRVRTLVADGHFPPAPSGGRYPWPLV